MMYESDNGLTKAVRKLFLPVTDSDPVAIYLASKLIGRDIQSLGGIAVHEYQSILTESNRDRESFVNRLYKLKNEYYEQSYGQMRLF